MENKPKSVVEQFLEGTNEGSNFDEIVDPLEVPLETKEEEIKEEKPIPFNKDPRVIKFIEREVAKRIPQYEEREEVDENKYKDVMDAMTVAIGNDTPEKVKALEAYEKALRKIDQESGSRTEKYLSDIQNQERQAEKEAEDELDNAFETIEEQFDVDLTSPRSQKVRSDFLTFVERIAPKNRDGEIIDYPDMTSAWETFSEIQKSSAQPNKAKQYASRGIARSSEATTVQPKRVDWNAVDEFMDTLK